MSIPLLVIVVVLVGVLLGFALGWYVRPAAACAGSNPITDALWLLYHQGLINSPLGGRPIIGEPRRYQLVRIPASSNVIARMPSTDERQNLDIPDGTPVLVIDNRLILPANRYTLSGEKHPPTEQHSPNDEHPQSPEHPARRFPTGPDPASRQTSARNRSNQRP